MAVSNYKHSLRDAKFKEAKLENIDFSEFDLQNCIFHKAALVNVKFLNANLEFAEFMWASLYNIDFTGANLSNVNFAQLREIQNVTIGGNSLDDFNPYPWEEDLIFFKIINHGVSLFDVYRRPGDLNDSWDIVHQQEDGSFDRIPNAGYKEEAVGRTVEDLRPQYVVEYQVKRNNNGYIDEETFVLANNLLIAHASC
jgi:Pentapeptide repeats (9 copies)